MNELKKKVCFFSGDISRNGGTERVTSLIANGLVNKGYNITILSFQNGEHSFYELDYRIKLYSLHMEKYQGYFKRKITPYTALNRFLKQQQIDIIIDVDVLLSLYTLPQKLFTNIKVISWEHFNFYSNNLKNRNRARRLAAKFSDLIIVLNKTDMASYRKSIKKIKNIHYIYNPAVCKRETKSDTSGKVVIAVGRLCFQKNFSALLGIWKRVSQEAKDWNLLIIGSGEEKNELEKRIIDDKIKNVKIIPFTSDIELYYEQASIYVMTSRYEGFPMVLLEAQKKGLPLISFDCPTGPSEIIINNRNGFLIPNNDAEEMKIKMLTLMNDESLRKKMSDNAVKDANRFELDVIINEWCKVLNNF